MAIGGTLGDFQITVETGDFSQVMQVGAIILGGKGEPARSPMFTRRVFPLRF